MRQTYIIPKTDIVKCYLKSDVMITIGSDEVDGQGAKQNDTWDWQEDNVWNSDKTVDTNIFSD